MKSTRPSVIAVLVLAQTLLSGWAQPAAAVAVPAGFAVTSYATAGGAVTSITFGPDTRDLTANRLYVADFLGGRVLAIDDVGGVGSPPAVFATGFRSPLGVVVADDGTVFVADAEAERNGPFGERPYGRVWRLRDTNGDGVADVKAVVLKDLPNGRHNTNGMALGADGMLYVTNGNSTDDGIEGGQPEVIPWSGSVIRVDPAWTDVSLASLRPSQVLVATGMRNDFDIAFSPFDPSQLFITMNGVDDAREESEEGSGELEDSDDLLYAADVDDVGPGGKTHPPAMSGKGRKTGFRPIVEDFGFPSCLYNVERQGNLEPYDNPHPQVMERFGPCPVASVPRPLSSFGAHPSADGLAFQTSEAWGPAFRGDLFVAEFGNFFGEEVVGHDVVRVELDATGTTVTGQSEFLTGALPLDVTFDAAGNLYVADFSGEILKVTKVL